MPPVRRSGPAGPRPPRRARVAGTRGTGPVGTPEEVPEPAPADPTPPAPPAPAVPAPTPPAEPAPVPVATVALVPTDPAAESTPEPAGPAVVIRKVPRATEPSAAEPPSAPGATAGPAPVPVRRRGLRAASVMLVLAVVLGAFAVVASFEPGVDSVADGDNTALVDTAATDEVAAAAVDAIQKTYSYSFSTIASDLTAATDLMTPDMAAEHETNIATIQDAVTQAQTTSKAQVTSDGVRTLQGDRAEVVAFVVVTSDNAGTALAPVPLRFTAQMQQLDGTWKPSGLVPS